MTRSCRPRRSRRRPPCVCSSPAISGVPGEAEEAGVRQGVAHVQREGVVLGAVRFVGDDDDVGAVREHRVLLALLGPELLDQREDVAVVLAQQLPQVLDRRRAHVLLARRRAAANSLWTWSSSSSRSVTIDEGPVAGHRAQHLLREEHHRELLPEPCVCQNTPSFAAAWREVATSPGLRCGTCR